MPIVTFHLAEEAISQAQCSELLQRASERYAEIFESPIDRVRAFVRLYPNSLVAVSGKTLETGDKGAPFFEFYALKGRPAEQRHGAMLAFTELLAETLAVSPQVIRGCCIQIDPDDWCIAGSPASELRKQEIEHRRQLSGRS